MTAASLRWLDGRGGLLRLQSGKGVDSFEVHLRPSGRGLDAWLFDNRGRLVDVVSLPARTWAGDTGGKAPS